MILGNINIRLNWHTYFIDLSLRQCIFIEKVFFDTEMNYPFTITVTICHQMIKIPIKP